MLYDRFTALDAIGPYEVLSRLPGGRVTFVAAQAGPVRTDNGMLTRRGRASLDQADRPDIVLVPGGPGESARARGAGGARVAAQRPRDEHLDDVGVHRLADPRGGGAARRAGARPATGWRWRSWARLGAEPVAERVVFDGKLVTAAGVSAGIDMALALAARVAGETVAQAIQLGIEYDPQPPFDAGSPQQGPGGGGASCCATQRPSGARRAPRPASRRGGR